MPFLPNFARLWLRAKLRDEKSGLNDDGLVERLKKKELKREAKKLAIHNAGPAERRREELKTPELEDDLPRPLPPEELVQGDVPKSPTDKAMLSAQSAGQGSQLADARALKVMAIRDGRAMKAAEEATKQTAKRAKEVLHEKSAEEKLEAKEALAKGKEKRESAVDKLENIRRIAESAETAILGKRISPKSSSLTFTAGSALKAIAKPVVDFLFSSSSVSYHGFLAATLAFASSRGFSPAWSVLVWSLVEGIHVVIHIKKVFVTKYLGIPFRQLTEPAFHAYNPGSETVGWANRIVARLWLCANGFLNGEMRGCVNRMLGEVFDKWRVRLLLRHLVPEVTSLTLGRNAPWISSIKTYTSEAGLQKSQNRALSVDVGVNVSQQLRIVIICVLYFVLLCGHQGSYVAKDRAEGGLHLPLRHRGRADFQRAHPYPFGATAARQDGLRTSSPFPAGPSPLELPHNGNDRLPLLPGHEVHRQNFHLGGLEVRPLP